MYNNIYNKFTYYFRSIFVDDNVINRIKVLERNLENTNQNSSKIQKTYTEQLDKFEKNLRSKMDIIENKVLETEQCYEELREREQYIEQEIKSLSTDVSKNSSDIIILKNYINTNIKTNNEIEERLDKFQELQVTIENDIQCMEKNYLKLINRLNDRIDSCEKETKNNHNLFKNIDNMKQVRKMLVMN
jgi:chromosome segregation ATPase